MATANKPPVVTTHWLADNLQKPNLKLFDCTTYMGPGGNQAYDQHYKIHHIPGAAHLDLASEHQNQP